MSATAQLPRPGDMIAGKYVLDRLLGQGGMGAVFAARHLKLSKAVAIKIMLADASNPEASQRFINEGRAAANIQNEHVVRVDDVDEEMGYAYMVLELLEGQDLAQILDGEATKRIAPQLAVSYVLQGLKGVAQAHALGIVHRDLKPSNLFLAKRKDGTAVVKVLDFGISKATGLNAAPNALTSTKAMLGSPLYMSPEQLRNAKGVDHRADIWAMGVILYELITGALPFMGDNLGELFANILESDPLPLRQRAGDTVPPGLDDVVMRCLQRKPEQRYQSVAELMQALAHFEHSMVGGGTNVGLGALGGTAFLPAANVQTAAHAQVQAAQMAGAISNNIGNTGPQFQPPHRGATASQPNLTPPHFVQTTGSGWQQGSAVAGLPKSRLPLLFGVFAAVAVIGTVLLLIVWKATAHSKDDPTATHPPPPASSTIAAVEPPASNTTKTPDEPPPPDSASADVSVAVPTPPAPAPAPAPNPGHSKPPPQPVVHPPAPAPQPQPVVVPVPAPQPKPKGQPGMEDHR